MTIATRYFLVLIFFASFGCENPASTTQSATTSEGAGVFSCQADSDCTTTTRPNVPTNASECTCEYLCAGVVVNLKEKQKREDAYDQFCGGGYRSGNILPTPIVQPDGNSYSGCPVASCTPNCVKIGCVNSICASESVNCNNDS